MTFCTKSWRDRLVDTLHLLHEVQSPFLEAYWRRHGYPVVVTFNGRDETPYPKDDLLWLYDTSLEATRNEEVKYYRKLRAALDPVRGILRSHPALSRALGPMVGNDKFMVEMANGASLTWLSWFVVGLMQRASEFSTSGFESAAEELGALLNASMTTLSAEVPRDLDLGYDALLFSGPKIDRPLELKSGLKVVPFASLEAWVEPSWIRDYLPEHVDRRDWRQIGAIVRPFRWRPHMARMNKPSDKMMPSRPGFEEEAFCFLELLAVSNQTPIIPFVLVNDCLHQAATLLLGKLRGPGSKVHVDTVDWRHDPFRNPPKLHENAIQQAVSAFERRETSAFKRLELVRRRLSESLAREGRFALDDRILDVSQSIELMLEIRGNNVGKKFVSELADLLSSDAEHNAAIRAAAKKFYNVRSAIVHGPSDEHRRRLMQERALTFRSGFNLAQQAYFKLIHDKN